MSSDFSSFQFDHDVFSHYARNIIQEYHDGIEPMLPAPMFTAFKARLNLLLADDITGKGVGIVGGGVGGLYAAMMLQSLGIDYEILEATKEVGGRLYTYRFDKKPGGHEYFDVGAMRFPETPMMKRTFHLFELLKNKNKISQIEYKFRSPNSTLLYNTILKQNGAPLEPTVWNYPFPEKLPEKYQRKTVPELVNYVVDPFVKALAKDIQTGGSEGWKMMMNYDKYSTRAYMLLEPTDPSLDPEGLLPYPSYLIDFLETFDKSTGWYDNAFTETVLEQMAFAWPLSTPGSEDIKWWCLDGGSQTLAYAMQEDLKNGQGGLKLNTDFHVSSIVLSDDETEVEVKSTRNQTKKYTHVITTTTLSCLRVMDLDRAKLDPAQCIALRELQYGAATKIGIQFKSQWWTDKNPQVKMPFGPIHGGQSYTDRSVRTVVYPSYGESSGEPSRVLMVNYAWTNDAVRLTGLISSSDPEARNVLKDLVFRDLIAIHNLDPKEGYKFLEDQFVDWYPFSWVTASNTLGAYAFFGPGQFKNVYRYLTIPAAKGRLYFAGEAISPRHAWVVGALSASWRAVHQIICATYPEKKEDFYRLW
ncbi:FAD/NAD(P)-binding domain-containing protein, partial [Dendrothele bispora CBS 962.96]